MQCPYTRKQKQTSLPQFTLNDLANLPRWVAWREEWRQNKDGTRYLTKTPYDPNVERRARIPSDPSTWGTYAEAETAWHERYEDKQSLSGVGIVLGKLTDGKLLMGIDLDSCFREDGDFQPWAVDVLIRIDSYAEVSPSGKGAKQFFLVAAKDAEAVKQLLGKNADGTYKTRRAFAADKHHELAIDRARFYAVTGDQVLNLPETLRTVSLDDVRWLIEEAGPAYLAQHGGNRSGNQRRGARDESGSGHGFRFMGERKAAGDTYEHARRAIMSDQGKAGEWARRVDERQIQRAWGNNAANGNTTTSDDEALETVCVADVDMKEVDWVWPLRLARGKLTMLSGDPGFGKSQIGIYAATCISSGDKWLGGQQAPQGSVIILAAEDAVDDTIRPRLEIGKADVQRVHVVKMVTDKDGKRRAFNLRSDLDKLRKLVEALGDVVLVIVDPISAYMGEKIDSHMMTSVNSVMSVVADFAATANVAVLAIHHPPKDAPKKAIHAFSGSLAFAAGPRLVFIAGEDPNEPERYLLLAVKNNLGPKAPGLGYRLVGATVDRRFTTSFVQWDSRPVTVTATEALRAASGDDSSKFVQAQQFLLDQLRDGERPMEQLYEQAQTMGISERTLKRAKQRLKIITNKSGFGITSHFFWQLPQTTRHGTRPQRH